MTLPTAVRAYLDSREQRGAALTDVEVPEPPTVPLHLDGTRAGDPTGTTDTGQ